MVIAKESCHSMVLLFDKFAWKDENNDNIIDSHENKMFFYEKKSKKTFFFLVLSK